jgi:RHS repeat-associated protein
MDPSTPVVTEGARTIYYVGKDFERVYWDDGRIEERSYIGPSVVVYRQGVGAPEVRYRHGDRLNSLDAATDSSGKEMPADLHRYDAFGKPRGYDWHANPGAALERLHASEFGVTTNNGFTTHEHLDEVYLIHMNGQVYDYRLGRFLSVDPIISTPANSQSINPYSYIGNSPLSGVDPTGYVAQGAADDPADAEPPSGRKVAARTTNWALRVSEDALKYARGLPCP